MKIAIVNAQDWNERRGGGELSIKYWYNKGIQQGYDISMVTNNKPDVNKDYDYYVIGNYPEMNMDYITWITNNKPHVFVVTNSIHWTHLDIHTRNAKGFIFMAPDHALQHRKQHTKHFFTPPYIDHTIFKPLGMETHTNTEAYYGLIHPLKVNQNMVEYIKHNQQKEFYLYGDNQYPELAHIPNIRIKSTLDTDEQVCKAMNSHDTLFWRLDRYGCYGRTIVEALLCGMQINVNREAFGLFKYSWIDADRKTICSVLDNELDTFWGRTLALFDN